MTDTANLETHNNVQANHRTQIFCLQLSCIAQPFDAKFYDEFVLFIKEKKPTPTSRMVSMFWWIHRSVVEPNQWVVGPKDSTKSKSKMKLK